MTEADAYWCRVVRAWWPARQVARFAFEPVRSPGIDVYVFLVRIHRWLWVRGVQLH